MALQRFAHYEVLGRLATGGSANIFLAREPLDDGTRRLACLKTLRPELAQREDFVAMFVDEARLVAQFDHPSCVEIYGYGRERDVLYIALEYILGESISEMVRGLTETLEERIMVALSVVASAAEALHHAHELRDQNGRPYNLVHRDVSPENVMVTYDGRTKLLDFGIAKAETGRAATATGVVKGKFSYMSPEQIMADDLDRRSDIFSLGVVLHECITQRPLYGPAAPREVAAQILGMPAARLSNEVSGVPQDLDVVCARALERELPNRYATALEFATALRKVLERTGREWGPRAIGRLVQRRVGGRVEQRKQACERAIRNDDCEVDSIVRELGLRPVLPIDLLASLDPTRRKARGVKKGGALARVPVKRSDTGWAVEVARLRGESLEIAGEDTVHDSSPRIQSEEGEELTIDAAELGAHPMSPFESESTMHDDDDEADEDEDPTVAQARPSDAAVRAHTEVRRYLESAQESPVVFADRVGGRPSSTAPMGARDRNDSETERDARRGKGAAQSWPRPAAVGPNDETSVRPPPSEPLPLSMALPLFAGGTFIGMLLGVALGRQFFLP